MNFAFIGCGNIAYHHLDSIEKLNQQFQKENKQDYIKIKVLIDINESQMLKLQQKIVQNQQEVPVLFKSYEEALLQGGSDLFDSCLVMVPSIVIKGEDLHEKIALQVLESGKNLLLEKPIANTLVSGKRLVDYYEQMMSINKEKDLSQIAENAEYWPEIIQAQKWIKENKLGEIISVYARFWESVMGPWSEDYKQGGWRCDKEKFDPEIFYIDASTHWLRPLRNLFGDLESICSMKGSSLPYYKEASSMTKSLIKFKSGVQGVFESILVPKSISGQPWFRIQGSLGEIVIDGEFEGGGRIIFVEGNDKEEEKIVEMEKGGWRGSFYKQMEQFYLHAKNKWTTQSLENNLYKALYDLKIIYGIKESSEMEKWVKI